MRREPVLVMRAARQPARVNRRFAGRRQHVVADEDLAPVADEPHGVAADVGVPRERDRRLAGRERQRHRGLVLRRRRPTADAARRAPRRAPRRTSAAPGRRRASRDPSGCRRRRPPDRAASSAGRDPRRRSRAAAACRSPRAAGARWRPSRSASVARRTIGAYFQLCTGMTARRFRPRGAARGRRATDRAGTASRRGRASRARRPRASARRAARAACRCRRSRSRQRASPPRARRGWRRSRSTARAPPPRRAARPCDRRPR